MDVEIKEKENEKVTDTHNSLEDEAGGSEQR